MYPGMLTEELGQLKGQAVDRFLEGQPPSRWTLIPQCPAVEPYTLDRLTATKRRMFLKSVGVRGYWVEVDG